MSLSGTRLTSVIGVLVVLGMVWVGAAAAQGPAATQNNRIIRGRVLEAGTLKPIDNVQVAIAAPSVKGPAPVRTGPSGEFAFGSLSTGSWQVTATAPGFYGSPMTVVLPAGDSIAAVDIVLKPLAVLDGIVRDETGAPVRRAQVRIYYRRSRSLSWVAGTTATTDDQGRYRFASVIPGEYLVAVISVQTSIPLTAISGLESPTVRGQLQGEIGSSVLELRPGAKGALTQKEDLIAVDRVAKPAVWLANGTSRVYPTHFHPGGQSTVEAVPVVLSGGEQRTGVDVNLRSVAAAPVTGKLTLSLPSEKQLGIFAVGLYAPLADADPTGFPVASTVTTVDGQFRFPAVPLGRYVLRVFRASGQTEGAQPTTQFLTASQTAASRDSVRPSTTEGALFGNQEVTVTEAGLKELSVALQSTLSVGGRVVFEGPTPPPTDDGLAKFRITAVASDGRVTPYRPTSPTADGRFEITGLEPGSYVIRASATGVWRLVDARIGGVDHAAVPIAVQASLVANVVLRFSDRLPEVVGRVRKAATGDPAAGAHVLIFPEPRNLRSEAGPARSVRAVRAASDGTYTATALPPGAYLAAAVAEDVGVGWNAPGVVWNTPEYLQRLEGRATRFSLALGDRRALDLTVPDRIPSALQTADAEVDLSPEGLPDSDQELADALPIHALSHESFQLAGRVLDRKGEGLAEVTVTARRIDQAADDVSVRTDETGQFAFESLPAGRYVLSGRKPGYLEIEYGGLRARQPGSPVSVGSAEKIDIRFILPRASALAGTVTDEGGRPLPSMTVQLLVMKRSFDTEALQPARDVESRDVLTDEQGRFRLYGVPPGEYFLGVTPPAKLRLGSVSTSSNAVPTALASTFYPNAQSISHARRLTIGEGEELVAVDVYVPRTPVAVFTGTTSTEGGAPAVAEVTLFPAVPYVPATFVPTERGTAISLGGIVKVTTKPDGSFAVRGLSPGRYQIVARSAANSSDSNPGWAILQVEVTADAQNAERIVLRRGAVVAGRFQVDDEPKTRNLPKSNLSLSLNFAAGGGLSFPRLAVDGEGNFTFPSVPAGTYWPLVHELPGGVAIERVLVNGMDVTGSPIEVRDNVKNTVVLHATAKSGHLTGRIVANTERDTSEYFVVLVPVDPRYWNPTMARGLAIKPDASGEYEFSRIPAGKYKILLTRDISQADLENRSTLRSWAELGLDVEVTAGATRRQDLKVVR